MTKAQIKAELRLAAKNTKRHPLADLDGEAYHTMREWMEWHVPKTWTEQIHWRTFFLLVAEAL